jgi:hypothetical protein
MSKRFSLLLLASAISASGAATETWSSQLFPKVGGKFTIQTANFVGRNWTLDDFSYAGYRLGEDSLGNVPCHRVVRITGRGDISAELQQAIDAVGTAGGGIVAIPKGHFTMSSAVSIPYNNVSILGESSADTLIRIPSNYDSHEGTNMAEAVFTFGRKLNSSNRGWVDRGPVIATVSSPVPRGAVAVETDDASKVGIGSWVVVQQYFWQTLVDNNSRTPDKWQANSTFDHSIFSFSYLRRVISKSGNRIVLDAPVPTTLDPANNPVHIRLTDGTMHENSGIARLTISFEPNIDPRTGRPHGTAVYFEGMRDGWVYDVHLLDFPRNGFYADFSARITFLDSSVKGAQDKGGNGYGYGFLEGASQSILYRRCRGEDTRHNFISSRSLTSLIVYNRCVSVNATEPDDTHYAFEQAILWDNHTQLNGDSLTAFNRGDESNGAYETLASGVIWNFFGDGLPGRLPQGGAVFVKPSPDGEAIVIGVNGKHRVYDNSKGNTVSPFVPGDPMPAFAGFQVGIGAGALGNVLYEGLYQPGLDPESLYDAQLQNRIGAPPSDFHAFCPSETTVAAE